MAGEATAALLKVGLSASIIGSWILTNNFWSDVGRWVDTAVWMD
jgi:putative effector of murein hydrolase LrgA (UPF0299 family)